jgi:hypothetical protein
MPDKTKCVRKIIINDKTTQLSIDKIEKDIIIKPEDDKIQKNKK